MIKTALFIKHRALPGSRPFLPGNPRSVSPRRSGPKPSSFSESMCLIRRSKRSREYRRRCRED